MIAELTFIGIWIMAIVVICILLALLMAILITKALSKVDTSSEKPTPRVRITVPIGDNPNSEGLIEYIGLSSNQVSRIPPPPPLPTKSGVIVKRDYGGVL